jgi:replication factor C subunit 3/5
MLLLYKYVPEIKGSAKNFTATKIEDLDNLKSNEIIDKSYFHKDLLQMLYIMSRDESVPHIIFYGPEGSGKKIIIKLFLEMLYDSEVNNISNTEYTVIGSGNKPNKIMVQQSNYHIVIEPNNNNFDRYLIQDIVKEYARKVPLNVFKSKRVFKTVLINSIDNMSYYAQTSLRRTMEKYSGTCRFIMWCHTLSRVIDPLKSRCICLKVPSPSDNEMFRYTNQIATNENINLTLTDMRDIIKEANGNIKKVLWFLQLIKVGYTKKTIYETKIEEVVDIILKMDLSLIKDIRGILYNIMITNIDGSRIMIDLVEAICRSSSVPDRAKYFIRESAARIEHNLIRGRREIIHLDSFVISVIKILSEHRDQVKKQIKIMPIVRKPTPKLLSQSS